LKKYGSSNSSNFDNFNLINPLLNMFLKNSMQNTVDKNSGGKNKKTDNGLSDINKAQNKKAQSQTTEEKTLTPTPFDDTKYCKLIERHDKISMRIDRKNNFLQEK